MSEFFLDRFNKGNWQPSGDYLTIHTIDAHTEGEPMRVITGGYPPIQGDTILEMRRYAREHVDHARKALMWEPRGHADMYGCLITPPVTETAHFGVLFLHNEGYSTMCGHGIIAVTKVVLETGMLPVTGPQTPIRIDSPAGLISATAHIKDGIVDRVSFINVPSFVQVLDQIVEVPGLGAVRYDIAYGGAFYAYVRADELQIAMTKDNTGELIDKGMAIKRAVMAKQKLEHPFQEDLNFLYGTIFTGPPLAEDAGSRNVCIFAEGEVDRSPTGTGVSGRVALHHRRGELQLSQSMVIESIIGSRFTARAVETTRFGQYDAVIPEVEGRAWITGHHQFLIDPSDPLREGFILR